MPEQHTYARFLVVFASYTRPGEWITASRLARKMLPGAPREFRKEIARKLSNLERFGHLERRRVDTTHGSHHEYRRPPEAPVVLPPELCSMFRFARAGVGRPIERYRQLVLWLPDPSLTD